MLTRDDLNRLTQDLREEQVLSVYIGVQGGDFVERNRWRLELRHSLDDIATWLQDAPHADRALFEALRQRVEERLLSRPMDDMGPGWVGFYTAAGPDYEEPLPVSVPTMAAWSTGACLAPYARVFREITPVIVAVVDRKSARVYRYAGGRLARHDTISAETDIEVARHMGRPSPQGFHTGTRGRTGTDAAQDALNHATQDLLDRTAVQLSSLAGPDGWIAVGGIPNVAAAVHARLEAAFNTRAMRADLDVHATEAQVAECARQSASRLRDARDVTLVTATLSAAEAAGAGVKGSVETETAVSEGRARDLFFTLSFLEQHAADAERVVRSAFDHGTSVALVSGDAATLLDATGGIAARLRFVAAPREPAPAGLGAVD